MATQYVHHETCARGTLMSRCSKVLTRSHVLTGWWTSALKSWKPRQLNMEDKVRSNAAADVAAGAAYRLLLGD